ncbi:cytochrome P450 [Actinomadura sp. DC4]|uniref:cytochrome P450 n=1 Tax=Actinomadura sp. DC4 TaxID=3055069 RepID=UPI0025B11F95|nr:cytochrome P450 [Actinomadura sp. DC4]MDN3355680.1 cytochrome P450 [Actinomadura sp. DC4]
MADQSTLDDARDPLADLLAGAAGVADGDRVLDAGFGSAADLSSGSGAFDRVVAQAPAFETRMGFFREAHRVLNHGGGLAVADVVLLGGRREERIRELGEWGSAVPADDWYDRDAYVTRLREAGFIDIELQKVTDDVRDALLARLPGDMSREDRAGLPANTEVVLASATKPVNPQCPALIQDPFTAYSEIRERTRLVRAAMPGVEPFWMVTRYDDAKSVLSDPRFVVNSANIPGMADTANRIEQYQLASGISPEFVAFSRANLPSLDGADHHRLRRLVSKAFTPRRVARLRPRVEEITARLLDRLPELAKDGVVDLLRHFATPLPLTVICELVGVPEDERDRFRVAVWEWMAGAVSGGGTRNRGRRETAFDYVRDLIERRRADPEDDLASALIRVHDEDGDRLSDNELVWTILSLVVAGYETTMHFITNGIVALLTNPDQLALLKESPDLMPGAVEELLRWCDPVLGAHFRYATEDVEVGGEIVRKGEVVMPIVTGANYDPRVFEDPDRLDLTREGGRDQGHIGFGHGLHFCLGAALARQEAVVAFEGLLHRFPDLGLAVDQRELRHGREHMWKFVSLPVRLSAEG